MTAIDLSVVLVTKRSLSTVQGLLDIFSEPDAPASAELIIVLDRQSSGQLASQGVTSKRVKVHHSDIEGRIGALRNVGIGLATGRTIFFIDDDCLLKKQDLLNAVEHSNCDQICRGRIDFVGTGFFGKIDAALRTARYDGSRNLAYTPNLMVPMEKFEKLGLFDERFFYGSDGEFSDRVCSLGEKIAVLEDLRVVHLCTTEFSALIAKSFRYGVGRYLRVRSAREKGFTVPALPPEDGREVSLLGNAVIAITVLARLVGFAVAPMLYRVSEVRTVDKRGGDRPEQDVS